MSIEAWVSSEARSPSNLIQGVGSIQCLCLQTKVPVIFLQTIDWWVVSASRGLLPSLPCDSPFGPQALESLTFPCLTSSPIKVHLMRAGSSREQEIIWGVGWGGVAKPSQQSAYHSPKSSSSSLKLNSLGLHLQKYQSQPKMRR